VTLIQSFLNDQPWNHEFFQKSQDALDLTKFSLILADASFVHTQIFHARIPATYQGLPVAFFYEMHALAVLTFIRHLINFQSIVSEVLIISKPSITRRF
jgi:hypothetical protein